MVGKVILGVVAGMVIVAAGVFAAYWHNNTHWYDNYKKQ